MIEKTQSFINSELSMKKECTNSVPKLILNEELTDNCRLFDKPNEGYALVLIKKELKTIFTVLSSFLMKVAQ